MNDILGKWFEVFDQPIQVVGIDPDESRIRLRWSDGDDGAVWLPMTWWIKAVEAGLVVSA